MICHLYLQYNNHWFVLPDALGRETDSYYYRSILHEGKYSHHQLIELNQIQYGIVMTYGDINQSVYYDEPDFIVPHCGLQ